MPKIYPNNNAHGANMGLIWGRQDPDGPRVGPMNLAIWVIMNFKNRSRVCVMSFPLFVRLITTFQQ